VSVVVVVVLSPLEPPSVDPPPSVCPITGRVVVAVPDWSPSPLLEVEGTVVPAVGAPPAGSVVD
jgi:hypothetical protein